MQFLYRSFALPFYIAHTEKLVEAAVNAAKRCGAIVALSGCFKVGEHYRNTTRVYHPDGTFAGDYYKQQLVLREPAEHGVENTHTRQWAPPPIVESNGIRLGFLTCYDAYFEEYIAHIAYRKPDIVLVAAFSITNTLITTVIQKTKEIGLLKSMGASSGTVMLIFVLQGAFVGILGVSAGILSGWLVVKYRMAILQMLRTVTGMEIFPKEMYLFRAKIRYNKAYRGKAPKPIEPSSRPTHAAKNRPPRRRSASNIPPNLRKDYKCWQRGRFSIAKGRKGWTYEYAGGD